jgi:hypothetical protein
LIFTTDCVNPNLVISLFLGLISALLAPILPRIAAIIAVCIVGYLPLIGIIQLVYVIPYINYLKKQEKYDLIKGIIVGAIITFLLNGGCWLMILSLVK